MVHSAMGLDKMTKPGDIFDSARKLYPSGSKRGLDTEFKYFCKKHKDWREVLPLLEPAIQNQINWRKTTEWRTRWKCFQSWIFNRYWELHYNTKHESAPRMGYSCGKRGAIM